MMNKYKAHEKDKEETKKLFFPHKKKKPTTTKLSSFFLSLFSSQKPTMSSSSSSSPTSSPKQITFYDAVLPKSRPGGTGSPSFSSSSSAASSDDIPSASATPLRYPRGGVPFSWEKQPGIPKKTIFNEDKSNLPSLKMNSDQKSTNQSLKILPLPPPLTPRSEADEARRVKRSNANMLSSSSRFAVPRDPFFAAFVECSKGEGGNGGGGFSDGSFDNEFLNSGGAKVTRSISDRFGFVGMYSSCKSTCAVSESIVYLPTRLSSSPARPPYGVISRRR